MTLKIVLENLDELDDATKALYVEKDGAFHLDVEKVEDPKLKANITEFRNKNIQLMKEKEDLKLEAEKYKEIDIDKYNEAVKVLQKLDDKKLFDDGNIDEIISKRTSSMKRDYEKQIENLTKIVNEVKETSVKSKKALEVSTIDNRIQIEIQKVGKIRKGTMEDIIARGRRIFSMDDNDNLVAHEADGSAKFGKDGVTPLNIKEWAEELPLEAAHFFEPSSGSGAAGGAGSDKKTKMSVEELSKLPPSERLKLVHSGKAK